MPEAHARQDPASVPEVLLAWVEALGALDQSQRVQQAILHLLNTRPGHSQAESAQVAPLLLLSMHHHILDTVSVYPAANLPMHYVVSCHAQ